MADTPVQTEADQREMTHGDIVTHNGTDYEVTAVSHQEDEKGNKINFQYTIRNKDELDAERKAIADEEARIAQEQADLEAAQAEDAKAREDLLNVNMGEGQTPEPTGVKQNG